MRLNCIGQIWYQYLAKLQKHFLFKINAYKLNFLLQNICICNLKTGYLMVAYFIRIAISNQKNLKTV